MKKGLLFLSLLLIVTLALLFFIRSGVEENTLDQTTSISAPSEEDVQITFLDIGQGDATFIEFPDGQQMLIDCAIDDRVLEALGRVMDFYDRDIDYLVVTHPDLDHYGGCIDVLKRFDIGHIIYNGMEKPNDQLWQAFDAAIEEHRQAGKAYTLAEEQFVWDIASTTVNFLYPDHSIVDDPHVPNVEKEPEANNTSIVIKLSYGDEDVLLMGDAEIELEEYLIATYGEQLDVDVLKMGHHGSQSSSSQAFIDATSPLEAIASCGLNNKFGHPSPRVLKRFERAQTRIWRTDMQGDIVVRLTTSTYSVTSQYGN